jgi:two-component system, LytTR family, sensor kinase
MHARMSFHRWLILCCIWLVPGVLTASQAYLLFAVKNENITLAQALLAKLPPWQVWALATPILLWIRARFPFDRARWSTGLLLHALLLAAVCTTEVALGHSFGRLAGLKPYLDNSLGHIFLPLLIKSAFFDLFIYCAVMATAFGLEYQARYREAALRQSQLEGKLVEAHLEALKMQLRPHFLFNTLNSISTLTRKGDSTGAVKMIDGLGELLRRSLNSARVELVPLELELDFIRRYLDIATTRFSDRLRTVIELDPAVRRAKVPNLLLQPLVENAIEHGIAPRIAGGCLEVVAGLFDEGRQLRIEIRDDGVGLSGSQRRGVGLTHVRERLAQLYPERHRFALEPRQPSGVIAVVELPLELEPDSGAKD